MSPLFPESLSWSPDGPTYFDLAMAIVVQHVEQLDDRRRDRFAARLQRWATANPPRASAQQAKTDTAPGDRYVAAITSVARRAVRGRGEDDAEDQSLFSEGVMMGMQRVVKYWGPGRRYPQRCPVRYSIQAVKSGCANAVRKHRRNQPPVNPQQPSESFDDSPNQGGPDHD